MDDGLGLGCCLYINMEIMLVDLSMNSPNLKQEIPSGITYLM